jgi:hypothetical protein
LKDQDDTDPEAMGSIMNALFDIEQGIEKTPPGFRAVLNVLLNRIIEKRLDYYMPLEDEEEDEDAVEDLSDNKENDS